MSLLDRLRRRRSRDADGLKPRELRGLLEQGERLLREGGGVEQIWAVGVRAQEILEAADLGHNDDHPEFALRKAWALLLSGNLAEAHRYSGKAANARPYDVDSRIVHGIVQLARGELEAAAHEFDAVIEEFGADGDAADGRRAVILAAGNRAVDELPAEAADWQRAARLLTALWRTGGVAEVRMSALKKRGEANTDTLRLLEESLHGSV